MYMVDYTSDDFKTNLSKAEVAIVPIGSVEAHGHHLPLGTDIFSPRLFCKMINDKISDEIWIAPEIPYGQSYDLSIYPGTIHIPTEVMSSYVFFVGKSLYDNGIKKLVFLNGHGGNANALNLASEKLMQMGMDIIIINWWLDFSKEILTITEGQGHAGEDESSAILYYNKSLVQMDKALKNDKKPLMRVYFKDRGRILYENALSGDATKATFEKGEKIFEVLTEKIIELIHNFIAGNYYSEENK
ncbi:creatininase family protein [Clostridium sp. YIM B02515]|uniref:Creatininase family protein n=1 Tax=Clostridium rhizosphaerae TaxID=2803861 RepID=A0ABS1TD40_9CLOT|nr:creatininase family protein [Clostridium rhizosphaerae]MBL4936259.1 creatininase family protein [Clostridium rhizosphaerae]